MPIKPQTIKPYTLNIEEEMILRDFLAADRTVLANERTFLAYIRTALASLVVGVSMFKFFDSLMADMIGTICIVSGIVLTAIGGVRYKEIREIVRELKKQQRSLKPFPAIAK